MGAYPLCDLTKIGEENDPLNQLRSISHQMRYQVVNGITGTTVKYACLGCETVLRSPLSDAGKQDNCPTCGAAFVVPGQRELEKKKQEQEAKQQARERAKEIRKHEKEERKRLAIQAEAEQKKREAEQRQREYAEQAERAQKLREELRQVASDVSNHDWSESAPWVYDCVEMGTLSGKWEKELVKILNHKAREGWEYFRSESLVAERPPGCFNIFGGPDRFSVVVLVFRRPVELVRVERQYRQ